MKLSLFRREIEDTKPSGNQSKGEKTVKPGSAGPKEAGSATFLEKASAFGAPFSRQNDPRRDYSLPDRNKAPFDILSICRLALSLILILVTVLVKGLSEHTVIILRILAAVNMLFDLIGPAVQELRRRSVIFESLPLILAVILAFAAGLSLEGALAALIFRLALYVRSFIYLKKEASLLEQVSLPRKQPHTEVGDSFMAEGGMRIPSDCLVLQGSLTADLSFPLGDRAQTVLKAGDILPGGSICLSGSALVEVLAPVNKSVSEVLSIKISEGCRDITKAELSIQSIFAWLTPVLLAVSLILLAVLPISGLPFKEALGRVTGILAIASPCGILISIPLGHLAAMAALRRNGIAFKSAAALDTASRLRAVVLEKAGVVTGENYALSGMNSDIMDPSTFLKTAAHAAGVSGSPIAQAIVSAFGEPLNTGLVSFIAEEPGWGVSVMLENIPLLLGTASFMERHDVSVPSVSGSDMPIYLAVKGVTAGYITLHDSVDPSIPQVLSALAEARVDRIAMVSSDSRERDGAVAKQSGIAEYYAECTPQDRIRRIESFKEKIGPGDTVAYVSSRNKGCIGSAAHLNIVLGCAPAPLAEGGALILSSDVAHLPKAVAGPKRAGLIIKAGVYIALILKLIIVITSALGFVPLWACVLLDGLVALGLLSGESYINNQL